MGGVPAAERAERVRLLLAPVVALLSAALAMCCLVTVPDVIASWPVLDSLEPATASWAGLAGGLSVAVATVALLGCSRVGSSPALALGVVAAASGLLLAHDVDAGAQLVVALVTLATAVGALIASGLCMLEELPQRWVPATFAGWLLPLAAGWGPLGWGALRDQGGGATTLGVHPPGWAVGAVAGLILCWAGLTLVREPPRRRNPSGAGWENAWAALAGLVAALVSIVMLVGFQPQLSPSWARPVVLLTTGVGVCGLLGCARLVPLAGLRPAFLAVVAALLTGPTCLHLMTEVSWEASGRLALWVVLALAAAGAAGCAAGWRSPQAALSGGLVVAALAAAGAWVLPSTPWLMVLAAAPFSAGLAASIAAGMRLAAASRMGVRYLAVGGLAAVVTGLFSAFPLTWALGAELTGRVSAERAGGRILVGLTFALLVASSAGVSVLLHRAGAVVVPQDRPVSPGRASPRR